MELLLSFWHFITHLNETLPVFISDHGNMVYLLSLIHISEPTRPY